MYYQVIGSKNIRPLSDYHASVSISESSGPALIKVIIEGISFNGSVVNIESEKLISSYSSKIFSLKVPLISPGAYRLHVQGRRGIDFISYYPLNFLEKSYSVLVETDRAVYNPGSKVCFRVLVLDSELKPVHKNKTGPIVIQAVDADGNKLRLWKNVEIKNGMFSDEFNLSHYPVLGSWNITVKIHDQEYFKTIRVAKYEIPGFRIDVDTKRHITFQDGKVRAKIKTYYHHGNALQGEATISAFPTIYSRVIQPIFQNPIRKVFSIDGSVTADFEIEKDLKLNDEYERNIVLDVSVEEKSNGRRENISVMVYIHKYPYKIDLIKTSDYFKPGLTYIAYVKVSRHDSGPLDVDQQIIIRHGFSTKDEVPIENKYKLNRLGIVKVKFPAPANISNSTALRIEAQYGDLKERISPVLSAISYSKNFLDAILETDKPLVNLDVEVSITCSEPMDHINYVVIGRGDVITSKTLRVDNKKNIMVVFKAVHAMVPLAHFIVSYVRKNGEMIGDTLDIPIGGLSQNFLDIKSSTTEAEPGSDLEIQMKAEPFSLVGLLAIDHESIMLGSDNILSEYIIADELLGYDSAMISDYSRPSNDKRFRFPWKPGGSNIHSGIEDSGGDLITNAHISRKKLTVNDIYLRPTLHDTSTVKPDRGFGLPIHPVTRPPLAGPYAFSRIPTPVWNIPKVYLQSEVLETWIFSNFSLRHDGTLTIRRRLPNKIGTWRMLGFSLDAVNGLGFMTPKNYQARKSFHIKLDLPYSLQRGEAINLPVHIYNNNERDMDIEVTFHNVDQNFEFITVSNDVTASKTTEPFQRRRVSIKKYQNGSAWFLISPLKVGSLEIKITASNPINQDAVLMSLLVEPGGETEYYSKSELVDLRRERYMKKQINFTLPKNIIPDSEKIEVAVVGNILGPILRNLDNVIRKPTGCGEQNLLHIMTNLIVLKYFESAKLDMPNIYSRAVNNLEDGYQTQMSFKRKNGGFSEFGERDDEGSVWITAYTLLAIRQASEFIYIDENILQEGYEWLMEKQNSNGSFYETGNIIHSDMQNRKGNSLPLTSFVLISFLENQRFTSKYKNLINKGLDYIARNIEENEETYSLALCSYALQLSKHPSKQSAFNLLDNRANYTDSMKWWSKPISDKDNPWKSFPRSLDIEMTSYALLSFLEKNLLEDAFPILNWLLKQQNDLAGFTSTQDTMVGLQALLQILMKLSVSTNLQIEFKYSQNDSGKFQISENEATIEQRFEISKTSREVNFTAHGEGLAIFKVYYQYNKVVSGPWPMFILDPQVDKSSNLNHLQLSICARFIKGTENTNDATSNMAVMEVNLPSGYIVDVHSLPSLEFSQNVQRVESKNKFTKVILYFNNVSSIFEYCPTISAFRIHKVANHRPVPVVLYDYYDTSRRARIFYRPPDTSVCDICTDIDCESACVISPKPQIREGWSSQKDGSILWRSTLISVCLPLLIVFQN
ncbi:CD109 antigen-like isoform X2 [Coccinella septempunctata]|uniref:CD109 antigen-like isoform X2 n=1 Tax=Coccinella septempunctata TaxID=41139 RepID=UPI001D07A121|nr:CD109 antigen-like isoform X2 [Coccinella septempunctata]